MPEDDPETTYRFYDADLNTSVAPRALYERTDSVTKVCRDRDRERPPSSSKEEDIICLEGRLSKPQDVSHLGTLDGSPKQKRRH